MIRIRNVCGALLVLSLLGGSPLLAQSLFGSRGPVAQFGQGFPSQAPANSLSSIPVAGIWGGSLLGPANSQASGLVGTGGNRLAGNRFADQTAGRVAGNTRGAIVERQASGSHESPVNQPDQTASTQRRGAIQVRQRIAFYFQPLNEETIDLRLAERFTDIAAQRPDLARVVAQMTESGELLLSGEVDSEDSRQLAEILARFEPGVRTVENRLTIVRSAK